MGVLVVDDAAIMRIVLRDILVRNCGYKKADIVEAVGGKDAMAKYALDKPEFVLCDISMPDMNGLDVVKAIIAKDPDAKIIMCTASSEEDTVAECIRAGAKDYIVKPPNVERLKQAVDKILGKEPPKNSPQDEKTGAAAEAPPDALSPEEEILALKKQVAELKAQLKAQE